MSRPNLKRQAILARTQARHQLLKLLYQWQISGNNPIEVWHNQIEGLAIHGDIEQAYLDQAWDYIVNNSEILDKEISQDMSRKPSTLDPVERAVLWIGLYEFRERPDIHPTVTINETIELAKQYGSEDGYKLVNGLLDKISKNITK
ncbi:transcription antitermination factor NusB [Suttonella ornithocola]|uniref:Transcription antitermination protein NusB n=1 Tax=Suttonella ornithocola TaxID=279832 RepID=A0A380MZ36_9GAMM|nr:transcription antitermination factor NusB [Suttonella ornithocola]SUO97163.1 N utilization substance protein B [Suttonella ornithocola]